MNDIKGELKRLYQELNNAKRTGISSAIDEACRNLDKFDKESEPFKFKYRYRFECFDKGLGHVLIKENGDKFFKPDNENTTYSNSEYNNHL